jgi:hypothetical protein
MNLESQIVLGLLTRWQTIEIICEHTYDLAFKRRKLWQWKEPFKQMRMIYRFIKRDWYIMRGQWK